MHDKDILEMLTVAQWALWKQYVKKNNVKKVATLWPDYDFHEFYTSLGHKEIEGEYALSEGRSGAKGSEPVVAKHASEGHGDWEQMELYTYDHVPKRRETHEDKPSLQEPGNGLTNLGPSHEQTLGVQGCTESEPRG